MVYSPSDHLNGELNVNRKLTQWFINNDPTDIILIPRIKVEQPGGGWLTQEGPPRPSQRFKLINQSGSRNGIVDNGDGSETKFEFILLGTYDAVIEIGDHWVDAFGSGGSWVVSGFVPFNGYERKATIQAYGKGPIGG